ncbi:hypothetical protein Dimus_007418 [Dionaea muscipula]
MLSYAILVFHSNTSSSDDGRGGGGGGVLGSPADERQKPGSGRLLLIKEEILRDPKSTMGTDKGDSDQEGRDEDGSNTGEEDDEDGEDEEGAEGLTLGEGAAEEDERRVGGAEEVEEDPGGEEGEEEEEGARVGEEGEGEDDGDEGEVVDAEVGVVLPDPLGGVGDGVRLGEGGPVGELGPWSALREAVADLIGEMVDEGAEGRGGDWGLGLYGGGCPVGGGGGLLG